MLIEIKALCDRVLSTPECLCLTDSADEGLVSSSFILCLSQIFNELLLVLIEISNFNILELLVKLFNVVEVLGGLLLHRGPRLIVFEEVAIVNNAVIAANDSNILNALLAYDTFCRCKSVVLELQNVVIVDGSYVISSQFVDNPLVLFGEFVLLQKHVSKLLHFCLFFGDVLLCFPQALILSIDGNLLSQELFTNGQQRISLLTVDIRCDHALNNTQMLLLIVFFEFITFFNPLVHF